MILRYLSYFSRKTCCDPFLDLSEMVLMRGHTVLQIIRGTRDNLGISLHFSP